MTLDEFVQAFAEEFEDTPVEQFTPQTEFKKLEEWGSLIALSIISMVDDQMEQRVTGADLRSSNTIEDLYNLISAK